MDHSKPDGVQTDEAWKWHDAARTFIDRLDNMIHFSIMKIATVADLRNHFRRISAWIEDGEAVEIVKRGKAFARLVPVTGSGKTAKVDFRVQREQIWGNRVFSSDEVNAMADCENEGEEG